MLEAQIISICDVYDAMCNRRPYREGLGHEEAVRYIASARGTDFRPEIVDAFLKVIETM